MASQRAAFTLADFVKAPGNYNQNSGRNNVDNNNNASRNSQVGKVNGMEAGVTQVLFVQQQKNRPFGQPKRCQVYKSNNLSVKIGRKFHEEFDALVKEQQKDKILYSWIVAEVPFSKMNHPKEITRMMRNAGCRSSQESEIVSYEILVELFGAKLGKTETEINYTKSSSKIIDFTVQISNNIFAVSVTRAYKYGQPFTVDDGFILLERKLVGLLDATSNVSMTDKWFGQILHIWAPTNECVVALHDAYAKISAEVKQHSLILISLAHNLPWIFS